MMRLILALLALIGVLSSQPAAAQLAQNDWGHPCGPVATPGHFGPYDYRVNRDKLEVVEWGHFRPNVERLTKPMFSNFGADLAYTLKAFPNHHRALSTMIRLYDREPGVMAKEGEYPYDCWFDRAMRWRSDDMIVRMLWASFLNKTKRQPQALTELEYVTKSAPDSAFTQYNVGMLYAEWGKYDLALRQAHRALQLGFEKPELKQILVKAGRWTEPAAAGAEAAGSAPSGTSPSAPTAAPTAAPSAAPSAGPVNANAASAAASR